MPKQAEVPGWNVGIEFLPDETLFSWCSRYHRLAANGLDRTTCMQLFGHPRIGSAHDFPARLAALVVRSHGSVGTAAELIRERTVLPFYLPFKPRSLGREAEAALESDGIGHLKYRLGLLTSGLGAAHPLKVCPSCNESYFADHGWFYWHRVHQLPGVWLCPDHGTPLRISHLRSQQRARFAWALPLPESFIPVIGVESLAPEAPQIGWLMKLARLSFSLVGVEPGRVDDPVRIAEAVRERMTKLGMTHSGGSVRWSAAMASLNLLTESLAVLPELSHQADQGLLKTQLLRLLSGRALTHPLRYLVWIATWFDDLGDFLEAYEKPELATPYCGDYAQPPLASSCVGGPDQARAQVLMAVCRGEISVTDGARRAGVAYATMAVWSSQEAFTPPRRPKKVDSRCWNHAIGMLRDGADKEEVATACQVSVVTVTRILRTVAGLQDLWHRVRYEQRQATARQTWSQVANLRDYVGIQAIRRLSPAAYAWLYRNDRDWLRASLNHIPKRVTANHATTRIENADVRMAAALEKLALTRNVASSLCAWTELNRALPAVLKVVRSPANWPRTVKVLASILNCRSPQTSKMLI